jgi:hypothetical protein
MSFFSEYWFRTILIVFSILFIGASYVRFIISHDYMVAYEGTCDEYTEGCFIGCEDEECTAQYYYTKMQKYAPTLGEQCGKDITDCENANYCLEGEEKCTVTYCDAEIDGDECEDLTEADALENLTDDSDTELQEQGEATDEDLLENITI